MKLKLRTKIMICIYILLFAVMGYFNFNLWPLFLTLFLIITAGSIYIGREEIHKDKNNYQVLDNSINIANETLPYFRIGLNEETAKIIVNIIKNIAGVPAVAITDRENTLAFVGVGCEKHPVGCPIRTQATIDAIRSGELKIIEKKEDFNCTVKDCKCPLESAIIVPLFNKNEVIGTIKLYDTKKGKISDDLIKISIAIGKLLSMQIELADLDRQANLVTEAKLDALQAQINPHFLFNSLNTINMYINNDPAYARKLIIKLSTFLRYLLGNYGRFITLDEELLYIEDYVSIEKARFKDKLKIEYAIDESLRKIKIPVFIIQPIVQNAIIHGIIPCEKEGTVKIAVQKEGDNVFISVEDNGIGIKEEDIKNIFIPGFGKGCGVGIPNVHERLKILYGEDYGLKLESKYGYGTKILIRIPLSTDEGECFYAESLDR